jgi:hypothetical protein
MANYKTSTKTPSNWTIHKQHKNNTHKQHDEKTKTTAKIKLVT